MCSNKENVALMTILDRNMSLVVNKSPVAVNGCDDVNRHAGVNIP